MAFAFLGTLLLFFAVSLFAPLVLGALAGVPDWGPDAFMFRLRLLLAFVALPLLSGILVLFAVGVRATFGIAGPLYRFRQVFRDLGALKIPRGVRIRKADTLQETAALFDESLVALHDHVESLQIRARMARERLEELMDAEPELVPGLEVLHWEIDELERQTTRIELLPRAPYAPKPLPESAEPVAEEATPP